MDYDCVVVGGSFAGLACASAIANAGHRVTVVEKKSDAGEKLHTTGILVKDAIDQVTLLDGLPSGLVRKIPGVRLYAPDLRYVDLAAPGYYFLSTDTPELLRWLAAKIEQDGARIAYRTLFAEAQRVTGGFDLGPIGTTRYLVGADGPKSTVAKTLDLGRNSQFLFGVEHEYATISIPEPGMLHCFVTRSLAPGYIAWIVAGPHQLQVGLAQRLRAGIRPEPRTLAKFLDRISPIIDLRDVRPSSIRAGMIPCGGLVSPVSANRVLLVGDAAGIVSPVTAGGIHTALKHGVAAGNAIADYLNGTHGDPCSWFVRSYPRFRTKRMLRFLFDHFQNDTLFNVMLRTKFMRTAAAVVYFHHKGAFDPDERNPE
jgi:flavin-dependent dehydrogenase